MTLAVIFMLPHVVKAADNEKSIITGFECKEPILENMYIALEQKPSKQELVSAMPSQVMVYLDGSPQATAIDVSWFDITNEYDTSSKYYYQFSPVWEDTYVLDEEIDLLTEVPYIAVFFTEGNDGIATTAVTRNPNEELIFNYVTETLGYNVAAACGILANIEKESSFNSKNLQGSYEKFLNHTDQSYTDAVDSGEYTNFIQDSAGYGFFQWTYWSRKEGLYNYAKECGTSIGDPEMQLAYFEKELKSAFKSTYNSMHSTIESANGAYDAAYVLCYKYEAPANKEDRAVERGNLAKNTYWPEYCHLVKTHPVFADVMEGAWYYDAVDYVYNKNIMTGMTEDTFGPGVTLNRAMVVTIIHRIAGVPATEYDSERFTDVDEGWFSDAVMWASENEIVTGYKDINGRDLRLFGAGDACNREQMVTILYRYAKSYGYDVNKTEDISTFVDAGNVSEYAREAMGWAVANGIISGENGTHLNPQGTANRAATATIIMRFIEKYNL